VRVNEDEDEDGRMAGGKVALLVEKTKNQDQKLANHLDERDLGLAWPWLLEESLDAHNGFDDAPLRSCDKCRRTWQKESAYRKSRVY
jgi:hypothetical protein